MRGEPTTAVIIHRCAHHTNTVMLLLLTVIPAERVKDVFACVLRLQERNYNIYLNHTSLLKAILLHSGIPEDKLSQASNILCDAMVSAGLTCITDVNLIAYVMNANAVLTLVYLLQSEKLTKREVEAKFCNFSLSTNSVSVPPGSTRPSVKIINPAAANFFWLGIDFCPLLHPVANVV